MKNRKFSIEVADLNYDVQSPKHKVRGYEGIDLKTRSVLGIFPAPTPNGNGKTKKAEPTVVVFAKVVPESFTVGEAVAKQKANTKKPPADVTKAVNGLHERPKLVDVTLLNKGAQIALTTGHKHPEEDTQYLPLHNFEIGGWTVQMYRVFLYRYDQIKNDHFIEVLVTKEREHPAEKPKVVSFYIPTEARNISLKNQSQPYEDTLYEWVQRAQLDESKAGQLRRFLYMELFGGRTEADFIDKKTKKYEGFTALRKLMVRAEKKIGNNTLSVFLSFVYWFWGANGRDNLENDMIGYYGKKFYTLYSKFMELAGSEYAQPDAYDFGGESEEETEEI